MYNAANGMTEHFESKFMQTSVKKLLISIYDTLYEKCLNFNKIIKISTAKQAKDTKWTFKLKSQK